MTVPTSDAVRVLVADPHPVVREGVKALFARWGLVVAGEAGDGRTALRLAAALKPDVVVLEADLPGADGAELTSLLRAARPGRRVVVFAGSDEPGAARRLLTAGASGYVLKRSDPSELVRAVRAAARGVGHLDPAAAVSRADEPARPAAPEGAGLSGREEVVLRLLALGYSNKEIAARLRVSRKTVETYKARAREKVGFESRVDLVRFAARRGWLTADAGDFISRRTRHSAPAGNRDFTPHPCIGPAPASN